MCKRAESEALAGPQGKQASGGPGSGEGVREQAVLPWPQAWVRAGQLVLMDLAGPNRLSQQQHLQNKASSG